MFVPDAKGAASRRTEAATARILRGCVLVAALAAAVPVSAALADEPAAALPAPEPFAVHGQLTYVEQESSAFNAPYRGPNSLSPDEGRETFDVTLYVGARLWPGAEGWLNTDVDQGFGLDDTLGVAGFPSGEAYKVGKKEPYLRLPRLFVRQTWDHGEASEAVEAAQNQLGGTRSPDRLVATIGKFGVGDVFDTNQYAHDPRGDFLNWGALDAASFDYAADAWGYTVGATLEWYQGRWTVRGGVFDLSVIPNSPHLDPGAHEFQMIGELERRHEFAGQPGRVLVTAFDSRGEMALLEDAITLADATGRPVDVVPVRRYRSRTGIHVSLEQQVSEELGVFGRVGGASGNVEAYEFTDVDRAVSAGLSLKGVRWGRADDTVALALLVNEASAIRRQFLGAGGLGILVGDGQLPHSGPEQILETYYNVAATAFAHVTVDYQHIVNPGYNRDRGPVSVVALRLHAQF